LIFAELKTDKGTLTVEQMNWIHRLEQCPGVEVFCLRPGDWETIVETLR
jgi:hypothetical protein